MKKTIGKLLLVILVFAAGLFIGKNPTITGYAVYGHCLNGTVQAIISPPAVEEMTGAIASARESLDVMLFQFSSSAMKEAVVQAVERGVKVRMILEPRVDSNLETALFLKQRGVNVKWASTSFSYTHAKLAVIDGKKVLLGSINWSRNALEKNREADVLIDNQGLAQEFLETFEQDWQKATMVK